MDALAWIGDVMQAIGRVFPRLVVVRATHGGVRFIRGSRVVGMAPGLHVYWPVTTEIEIVPTARQTYNLSNQSLLTVDGQEVSVGPVVVYEIADVVKALGRQWDVSDTIADVTQLAVVEVVAGCSIHELSAGLSDGTLTRRLTEATRRKLKRYGVRVHACALSDCTTSKAYRIISDQLGQRQFLPVQS